MKKFLRNFLGGWWVLILITSSPSFKNYQEGSEKSNYAFLQFFRKKEEELRIQVRVPPPPPPPGFEISPSSSPLNVTPSTIPEPVKSVPESRSDRELRTEPSPWQWF